VSGSCFRGHALGRIVVVPPSPGIVLLSTGCLLQARPLLRHVVAPDGYVGPIPREVSDFDLVRDLELISDSVGMDQVDIDRAMNCG
jgi:hypothetical protein